MPAPTTWSNDVRDVKRWQCVEIHAKTSDGDILLLRRILGWDHSAQPKWLTPSKRRDLVVTVSDLPSMPWSTDPDNRTLPFNSIAVRRVEPWIDTFLHEEPAVKQWNLRLPCVQYEIWCNDEAYEQAQDVLKTLPDDDLRWL